MRPSQTPQGRALEWYDRWILGRPLIALAALAVIIAGFGWFAPDFRLDVSADSLVLEADADLRYYRSIRARYGSDDYLIVTYTPDGELFAPETLADIRLLRDRLRAIERVDSVISILDVPLLQSPPVVFAELPAGIRTLEDPHTDLDLARRELLGSPLYGNRIVGLAGRTTALQINMQPDPVDRSLRSQIDALRALRLERRLAKDEAAELSRLTQELARHTAAQMSQDEADVAEIRSVLRQHAEHAELHLGGLPMIAADMMESVRRDIEVFGVAVIAALALLLIVAFGQLRWVALPLLTAFVTTVVTLGLLGLVDWPVTVVSSNFLALLLIFTLSLTIHLIVRYRELQLLHPERDQRWLVRETVGSKVVPSFFTVFTTMVAFGSLVVSDIRPVIDFGWIMIAALTAAFVLSFTLFPAMLMLLEPGKPRPLQGVTTAFTRFLAEWIGRHGRAVLVLTVALSVGGAFGMSALTVENRFIDNFKPSTEIYQGMYRIDRSLGGTTPLDVVIDGPPREPVDPEQDGWVDDFELGDPGITGTSYWFNTFRMGTVQSIHQYLDSLDETGKVLSLATTLEVIEQLSGEPDDILLAILYQRLDEDTRKALIDAYLSPDGDQTRFAVRVYESNPDLRRQQLIDRIRDHLTREMGIPAERVHLSGMLVLYNNMLQSLFRSQILTLGGVFVAILLTIAVLFRSLRVAAVAIIPNLVAAVSVLGLMGAFGIPLDMMTITIAAITIGIAVDDTIHYVHRFAEELAVDGDYAAAVRRSHGSIGRAMYYTSVTITVGFSILALSDFVPTIYFGLLTAFAMVAALVANLTTLPVLLVTLKPYGRTPRRTA